MRRQQWTKSTNKVSASRGRRSAEQHNYDYYISWFFGVVFTAVSEWILQGTHRHTHTRARAAPNESLQFSVVDLMMFRPRQITGKRVSCNNCFWQYTSTRARRTHEPSRVARHSSGGEIMICSRIYQFLVGSLDIIPQRTWNSKVSGCSSCGGYLLCLQ